MNLIKEPIINSMLDDDMYKFSQHQAFMELFPDAIGEYRFTNRGNHRFNTDFLDTLRFQINECLPNLRATDAEIDWLGAVCPFFKPWYLEALKNFRYDPNGVEVWLDAENNLVWRAKGLVRNKMLLEVKMMAIISELYFKTIDQDWDSEGQLELASGKARRLTENGVSFIDFGTRRRRTYNTQADVVEQMKWFSGFKGTSNVHLAHVNGLVPKGTMAHEWPMAMQALEGIRNSNYYALNNWVRVYNGNLGIALPDTLGSKQFLKNFGTRYAKLFDGVRWDSGDPYWFTDLFVDYYKSLNIDPTTKSIIYSNALNVDRAIEINNYAKTKVKPSFGIGTHFTGDFKTLDGEESKALNMVIKLWSINDIPVVKFSDDEGKKTGDKNACRVTNWMINGEL